jgi:hypothetical protein
LGLTGYYRNFVPHYGSIARSLTNLLHHKSFSWNSIAQESFDKLKESMTTTPVLAYPDFSKEFIIETDVCDTGIGAVLSQEGHPIAYFSKGLSVSNQQKSTYEKEFLEVMMTVDKWRSYLHKNPFVIKTNHQSLCYLQDHTLSTELQRKAMRNLVGLQFRFAYKKGSENKAADALSRVGLHFNLSAIFAVFPVWIQGVVNSYHGDADATNLLQELVVSSPNAQGFSPTDRVIRYGNKIWVGPNSALQTKLIGSFHSSTLGALWCVGNILKIEKMFHWQGLKN